MNSRATAKTEAVRERAEHWFARRRAPDFSVEERRDCEAWINASPEHSAAYLRTQMLWDDLGPLADDPEIARWRTEACAGETPAKRRFPGWVAGLSAAVLAACLVLATRYRPSEPVRQVAKEYATAPGEQHVLALEDGSHLTLNTDTRIRVRMDPNSREVELLRGEALFDVAHEAERPFHVRTDGLIVTDIGTSFDIHNDTGSTQVTLISGLAEVTRGGDTSVVELTPGDQLISNASTWRKQTVSNLASVTEWTSGHLVFLATPLRDAVAKINRYDKDRIVIADRSLEALQISGDFHIGNAQAFVRALQSAFPVRAETTVAGETHLHARR
ncbi:MAG: FecR family protein [Rudaea sp.]|uniref:FecR family protein n=1 Tax=Rudaea sp. TaxID=2136325 RepID=UPI0039E34724